MKISENKPAGRDLSLGEKAVVTIAMLLGAIVSISVFGAGGRYTPLIAITPACAVLAVLYILHSKRRKDQQ